MSAYDPRLLDFGLWSDFTRAALGRIVVGVLIPKFDQNLETWQDWGSRVLQNPPIQKLHPPNPYLYGEWREWAFRFNQAIGL